MSQHPIDSLTHPISYSLLESEEAIRVNPLDPEPYLQTGRIYLLQNEFEKALHYFEKVNQLDSEHPEALQLIAKLSFLKKDYPRCISIYRHLIQKNYKDPKVHYQLAIAYQAAGQIEHFLSECKKITVVAPHFAKAYYRLAIFYLEKKEWSLAEKELRQVIKINTTDSQAYFLLAKLYRETKQEEKCIEACMETLRYQPQHISAHFFLGEILYQHQDYELALQKFNECLQINHTIPSLKILRNMCYQKVEKQLLEAYQKDMHSIALQEKLAKFYFENNQYDLALKFLEPLINHDPKHILYLQNYLHTLEAQKKLFLSYQKVLGFLEKNPNHPELVQDKKRIYEETEKFLLTKLFHNSKLRESRLDLIQLYIYEQRLVEALEELEYLLEYFPEDYLNKNLHQKLVEQFKSTTHTLSEKQEFQRLLPYRYAYQSLFDQNFDQAVLQFQKLLESNPKDVSSWYALLRLYVKQHQYAQALQVSRKIKQLKPNYRHVLEIEKKILNYEKNRINQKINNRQAGLEEIKALLDIHFLDQDYEQVLKLLNILESSQPASEDNTRLIQAEYQRLYSQLEPLTHQKQVPLKEGLYLYQVLIRLNQWGQALVLIQTLKEQYPQEKVLTTNIQQVLNQMLDVYQHHLEKDSNQPETHFRLAVLFAISKNDQSALTHLEEAVRLNAHMVFRIRFSKDLAGLKKYPRFQKLITVSDSVHSINTEQ